MVADGHHDAALLNLGTTSVLSLRHAPTLPIPSFPWQGRTSQEGPVGAPVACAKQGGRNRTSAGAFGAAGPRRAFKGTRVRSRPPRPRPAAQHGAPGRDIREPVIAAYLVAVAAGSTFRGPIRSRSRSPRTPAPTSGRRLIGQPEDGPAVGQARGPPAEPVPGGEASMERRGRGASWNVPVKRGVEPLAVVKARNYGVRLRRRSTVTANGTSSRQGRRSHVAKRCSRSRPAAAVSVSKSARG